MTRVIAFEGIECSGKSTALQSVFDELVKRNYSVYAIGKDESPIDTYLRAVLQVSVLTAEEKFFAMCIRYLEKKRIITHRINHYDFILLDRYNISLFVFAHLLMIHPLMESVMRSLEGDIEIFKYIFLSVDYKTFCNRGGLFRTTTEGEQIDQTWFEKKHALFDEQFLRYKDKSIFCLGNTEIPMMVDQLCTDMC